jgi:hypothetical protein
MSQIFQLTSSLDIRVILVFTMSEEMEPPFCGLNGQQCKFAIACTAIVASKTNSPPFIQISPFGVALILDAKLLHSIIIRECFKECPFNVVLGTEDTWRILMRHQSLFSFTYQSIFYNFLIYLNNVFHFTL